MDVREEDKSKDLIIFNDETIIGYICMGISNSVNTCFKKEILYTLENIERKKLNKKEWDCIFEARRECKKRGWHNINREVQSYN